MYGQYSVHIYIHFELKIFIDIVSIWFISMKIFRYYCSSNSNHLVQIENWTRCDVWTIFSTHFSNTLWISNFYCNCIYIFNSMKIYQILLQLQLKLFSSNRKLNLLWCMDNIQYTFTYTLWIENFYWYCIYMIHFNEDLQILLQLQLKPFSSNWKLNTMWCMDNIQSTFTNTLWISNFHCNCICIFNSMKIYQILLQLQLKLFSSNRKLNLLWCMDNIQATFTYTLWIENFYWYCIYMIHFNEDFQILLQLQLKPFSSNWKLNTMWCMDNIQSTLYKYTLNFKFSLQLYMYI